MTPAFKQADDGHDEEDKTTKHQRVEGNNESDNSDGPRRKKKRFQADSRKDEQETRKRQKAEDFSESEDSETNPETEDSDNNCHKDSPWIALHFGILSYVSYTLQFDWQLSKTRFLTSADSAKNHEFWEFQSLELVNLRQNA